LVLPHKGGVSIVGLIGPFLGAQKTALNHLLNHYFKGDSQGGRKPATLESGAVVQIPFHILEGDVIRVDTRTGEYLEKVK
jgi:hypothetical protein